MRLAHHLLRHASGVFHFRLIVPADLQPLLGRRVIKQSLRTRDPTLARWWAYTLGARYAQLFATARSRGSAMAKEPREDGMSAPPKRREVQLRTGSGDEAVDYVGEVRADGRMFRPARWSVPSRRPLASACEAT